MLCRMKAAPDTRKAILKRAERYLQDAGFSSFSFRHLAADLGIKSASVHYHFPSKEELGVALLQSYQETFRRWAESRRGSDSARADLLDWFKYYQHLARCGDICPGGAFGAEYSALPARVREQLAQLEDTLRTWLRATLRAGRRRGEVRADGKVEDQAEMVLATLQGGTQVARVTGNPKAFDGVLQQLKVVLFT